MAQNEFFTCSEYDLSVNPFSLIRNDWMLICAGDDSRHNAMTASWGGLGVIWGKNVATCYIRPQRYTREFTDAQPYFSLNFFSEDFRPALQYFGKASGRDEDKDAHTGLTACFDQPAPYYAQANTVLICKKLYGQYLDPHCFADPAMAQSHYGTLGDYHKMYIGEIVKVLVKEQPAVK